MPFYRFEDFKSYRFNPHLSTADGPVIEGEYLYFRMVTKRAGTGAELHYHQKGWGGALRRGALAAATGGCDQEAGRRRQLARLAPKARLGYRGSGLDEQESELVLEFARPESLVPSPGSTRA